MKAKVCWVLLGLMMLFVGCEQPELGPIRVATGGYSWLSTESVTLEATISGNKELYESFVYGFYVSTDESLVAAHQAEIFYTRANEDSHQFYVSLGDLVPGTTYYYCGWVRMNTTENVYGEVMSFTTPTRNLVDMPFSVSPTTQVYFSSGNLQYHPVEDKWRFAKYQYEYIGQDNSNIDANYDGWIDLFGWGTGDRPTQTSNLREDYKDFVNWGSNTIENDSLHSWRTLTTLELDYLINKRPNARWLRKYVYVEGELGLMILPDGANNHPGEYSSMNKYYLFNLEQSGAVFLPMAGRREGKIYYESNGYYWTSVGYEDLYAHCFVLSSDGEKPKRELGYRSNGYSVRLVRDVEAGN